MATTASTSRPAWAGPRLASGLLLAGALLLLLEMPASSEKLPPPGCSSSSSSPAACSSLDAEEVGLLQVAAKQAQLQPASPNDIRAQLPACYQAHPEYCWTTTISEVAAFYNDSYRIYDYEGFKSVHWSCFGVECYIAGLIKYPKHPHTCCPPSQNRRECWDLLGTPQEVTWGIKKTVGVQYKTTFPDMPGGPLTQESLDQLVALDKPIILEIQWASNCNRHYVTLAGGDGQGSYHLHDSMYFHALNSSSEGYQTLTYDQVVKYSPPDNTWWDGTWMTTVYIDDPSFLPQITPANICDTNNGIGAAHGGGGRAP